MADLIDPQEPVAIIGLGGIFPGAPDVPVYWRNVVGKVDSIIEVPRERWDWRLYYDADRSAPDKTYSKIGGFVTEYRFDPLKLRIPPKIAQQMDSVQQLAVAATAEALRDAGYEDKPFDRERTAVVLGNSMGGPKKELSDLRVYASRYLRDLAEAPSFKKLPKAAREAIFAETEAAAKAGLLEITEDTMPGELSNVIAGRIANTFNLNGPNFTVDAACAASLGAIAQAAAGLRTRQFDLAVSGGVDQMMAAPAYVKFSKIGALSPDGSRPFDAGANGFVMGEGAGVLILKRLSDALRDGDRIYALLRAVGASSDGRGKGITAPNPKGQRLAIERTFAQLDFGPETVGLLEAHGTSTAVGDVVEVQAAAELFGKAAPRSVALGSVKSQIGHLKAAAGAASLVKTALALHHKTLPPSINFKTPNPGIDWERSPFFVNTEPREWAAGPHPRRACVSAFGFGGTNFHVALEEATPETTARRPSRAAAAVVRAAEGARPPARPLAENLGGEAFLFAGETPDAALNRAEGFAASLPAGGPLTALAREAATAAAGSYRLAVAAESAAKLREKLALAAQSKGRPVWEKTPPSFKPKGIHLGRARAAKPKTAFLFPGQGSQYVDMLKDLAQKYRPVAETFAEADAVMKDLVGTTLTEILWTQGRESAPELRDKVERIKQTEITQPAVLTADVALLRLLRALGIEPDIVAGHSLGEYGALVAAGVLDFKDALLAVSARGKEMAGVKVADNGKMASIAAPVEKVEPILQELEGYAIAANKNCPIQTVIAGATKAVEAAVARFGKEGVQSQLIEVSHAFHSQIVAPATEPYGRFLKKLALKAPRIPVLSNVTAGYYPAELDGIRKLMQEQISSPVEWIRQIERMYADGVRVFVEVGPKRALTAFATSTLEGKDDAVIAPSNHPKRGGIHEFNDLLARLWAAGVDTRVTDPAELYTEAYMPTSAERPTSTPLSYQEPRPGESAVLAGKFDFNTAPIVVSGIGAGAPGTWDKVFREHALDDIIAGKNLIEPVPEEVRRRQVEKNLERVVKSDTGDHRFERLESIDQVLRLAGQGGKFDIAEEFGVRGSVSSVMDVTAKLALAAGILALKDAQLPLMRHYKKTSTGSMIPTHWGLPDAVGAQTGVILATAFPGLDSLIEDISHFFADKHAGRPEREIWELYDRLLGKIEDPADRKELADWYAEQKSRLPVGGTRADTYRFSRSFLFRVLTMGHGQTAQFINAKGPCTQINAACASTTQAVGIAEDWIRLGRCKRVLVVAADDVTSPRLMEWIGTGFLASGATTTHDVVSEAALPFDRRRNGMITGMGAAALLIEDEREAAARGVVPLAELVASQFENSAYHPTRLQTRHVAEVMDRLVAKAEKRLGIPRARLAEKMLFMSHETYTPAQGGSSAAEVEALKHAFGSAAPKVVVTNTKGFTGHPMGVSLEDTIAVRAMYLGKLPPIANYKEPDPNLTGITLSKGGDYDCEYALRLAAGFGSQIAMTLMRRRCTAAQPRVPDPQVLRRWLTAVTGIPEPELEVAHNTLRVKDPGRAVMSEKAKRGPGLPMSTPADQPASSPLGYQEPASAVRTGLAVRPTRDEATVQKEIVALVAEKTGYPAEMLELDLDMEADLGIDTVKQAELIGIIREKYGLPKAENLTLKDYPTLRHVIRFVMSTPAKSTPADQPASTPLSYQEQGQASQTRPDSVVPAAAANGSRAPAAAGVPVNAAELRSTASVDRGQVERGVVALVAEKTGYPAEMLELDLDMEADLGIDTVKQAELIGILREKYGLPKTESLSLKDYPTLRHVIRFVEAGSTPADQPASTPLSYQEQGQASQTRPDSMVPAAVAAATKSPMAAGVLENPAELRSTASVERDIVALVAEKTGYPAEMLELDLDMEADLGIDTVKQAELIGILREKYGLPKTESLSLKDYPTLRHVIRFVEAGSTPADQPASTPLSFQEPGAGAQPRFGVWRLESYPRPAGSRGLALTADRAVVLLGDAELAKPFAQAIKHAGGASVLVKTGDWTDEAQAAAAVDGALKGAPAQGLVDLSALELGDFDKLTPGGVDRCYRRSARALFLAAKALRERLAAQPGSFLLCVTRMGGAHGLETQEPFSPLAGALTGLVKALARELPGVRVQAVDLDAETPPKAAAEAALAELGSDDPRLEVGFRKGERRALRLVPQAFTGRPARKLTQRSVVLITGGGQGLGAELAKEIARRSKATLVLIGRTPLEKEAAAWARMSDAELAELKKKLWEELKADPGRKATPALLEKEFSKVTKARELQRNIEEMARAGSKVAYEAADLADAPAVSRAVKRGLRGLEGADFVIHAAGLEESKLLADKKPEAFDRVVRAKLHGACHLLKAVEPLGGQTWAFFSSIVGRFGNLGQTDYAAASDFLAKLAARLRAKGKPAMTFDLSAFAEIGMATRGGVEQYLKSQGVDFLPPREGVALILEQLTRNTADTEVMIAGAIGKLDSDGLIQGSTPAPPAAERRAAAAPTEAPASLGALPAGAPLFDAILSEDGEAVVSEKKFSVESDPWLRDHAIGATPWVSGVKGLELFAETAGKLLGAVPAALEAVSFALPIKLLRGRPITVRAQARRTEGGAALRLESDFYTPQGIKLGEPREHFTARTGEPDLGWGDAKPERPEGDSWAVPAAGIYQAYFHGPRYQVLAGIRRIAEDGLLAVYRRPAAPLWDSAPRALVFSPLLIEAMFQACGYRDLHYAKKMSLPDSIGKVQVFRTGPAPEELLVLVRYKGAEGPKSVYDAWIYEAGGELWAALRDYRMILVA